MISSMKIAALLVSSFLANGPADPQDDESRSLLTYEVADLLSRPPNFEAGDVLGVRKADPETSADSQSDDGPPDLRRERAGVRLYNLIRAGLTAKHRGASKLEIRDGLLLVTATQEGHREITRLLEDLRRDRALRVRVEAAVVPVAIKVLEDLPPDLGRKLRRAAFEGVLPHPLRLAGDEADALLGPAPEEPDARKAALRVEAFNHQIAHTLVIHQSALIADLKISRQDGKTTAEPVIGVLSTGTVVQIDPAISEDRESIALGLDVMTAKLKQSRVVMAREMERFKDIPEIGEWPIQVPELERSRLRTTVNLPAGAWILVGSLRSEGDGGNDSLEAVLIKGVVEPGT